MPWSSVFCKLTCHLFDIYTNNYNLCRAFFFSDHIHNDYYILSHHGSMLQVQLKQECPKRRRDNYILYGFWVHFRIIWKIDKGHTIYCLVSNEISNFLQWIHLYCSKVNRYKCMLFHYRQTEYIMISHFCNHITYIYSIYCDYYLVLLLMPRMNAHYLLWLNVWLVAVYWNI